MILQFIPYKHVCLALESLFRLGWFCSPKKKKKKMGEENEKIAW